MRNGCPPLSGQGVIFPLLSAKRAYERSALRKKADKPRWYRGNFVIEIFVLSDSLIGVVAEDFFAGKTLRHRHSPLAKSVAPARVRVAVKRRPPHKGICEKAWKHWLGDTVHTLMPRSPFDLGSHLDERSSLRLRHRRMSLVQGALFRWRASRQRYAFICVAIFKSSLSEKGLPMS